MRLRKIMLIALALGSISVLSLSCASNSTSTPTGQVATVQRGNLSIVITGVGNLALSNKVDLAFDIPSSFSTVSNPLSVEQVLVQEADSVKEGQLLAKLDTSGWDAQIATLEDKVTAAERNVTTKVRAVTSAEGKVREAERNVPRKKLDVLNKQSSVNTAKIALEDAEETSTDPLVIESKKLALEVARGNLEDAQIAVEDARIAIEDAKIAVEDAKQAVVDAQTALAKAQKALDEAKSQSPEIRAPFAGFITKVNVQGGNEVKKGTVAVTLADPNKFEADISVNEMDMPRVTLGGNATARLDALSGVSLPAKVTHIAPSGTIQSGVVNYKVKVEISSLQAAMQERQAATGNVSSGAPSERFGGAFSGNLTQEQLSQIQQQQRQQAQSGQQRGQQSQSTTTIAQDFQLREGLTVTITIVVQQKSNVLLVANTAITRQGTESYVKVSKEGTIEERAIQTGISNAQYTEVTSGLSEGEKVIIPKATTTTSTSQPGQTPQSQMFIPGVGRIR